MEHERFPEKVTAWGCVLKKGQVMGWEHHTDLMVVDDQLMHKPRVAEAGMTSLVVEGAENSSFPSN